MNIEQQIYTSCPQGKGYDGISGFQVKARSSGLTDSMSRAILRYSNHYRVPRELRQLEYQYYQSGQELPPEFLDRFPVVQTYHHVEGEFYGLTRIVYRGKDYSGRPGNFYAHTLVFEAEALSSFNYNPIMLSCSGVFETSLDNGSTVLEPLTDLERYVFKTSSQSQDQMVNICRESYKTSYAALLPAFVQQLHLERPIILCFKEYVEATDYIEALLMLLPSETRSRTTFTTYEPDPYTLIKRAGGEGASNNLHIITTPEQETGGSFEFRPHEFTQFLIWNFASEKYSEFPESSPYAQTVIKLCSENRINELNDFQHLLTRLGAGRLPDTWNALIFVRGLENRLQSADALQLVPIVLEAVAGVARTEPQVNLALDIIWPILHAIALGRTEEFFSSARQTVAQLLERLPADSLHRPQARKNLIGLTGQVLVAGNVSRTLTFTELDKTSPSSFLLEVVDRLSQNGWPEISAQTGESDFSRTLQTLQTLAQEPHMREWVGQTLWQRIRSLTERPVPENYLSRCMHALIPLIQQLPPASDLRQKVTAESQTFIQSLLSKGCPACASSMLQLSGENLKRVMPQIYNALVAEGWPANVRIRRPSAPEDQQALMEVLEVAIETLLADPLIFERILPAFHAAELYSFADRLWLRFKDALIRKTSSSQDPSAVINFIAILRKILLPYNCPQEVFELLLLRAKLTPPSTVDGWIAAETELMQQALRCPEPESRIAQAIESLQKRRLEPADLATILVTLSRSSEIPYHGSDVITSEAHNALGKLVRHQLHPSIGYQPDWQGIEQTFQAAHSLKIADRLWQQVGEKLFAAIRKQTENEQVFSLVEALIRILNQYGNPDDLFSLLLWQTDVKVPETLDDWKKRIHTLTQFGLSGNAPDDTMHELFKRIAKLSNPQDQAILLAVIFQGTQGHPSVQNIVFQKYCACIKNPKIGWEMRAALAQEEHHAGTLLVHDFLEHLVLWPEDSSIRLRAWKEHIFSPYPKTVASVSRTLARQLQKQDISKELQVSIAFLEVLDEQFVVQCRPLIVALLVKAPLKMLVTLWKPWFSKVDLSREGLPQATARAALLGLINHIQMTQADRTLDAQKTIEYVQHWQTLRPNLDQEAQEWAVEQMLNLLSRVDLSSTKEFWEIAQNSLREYDRHDRQAAVSYVKQQFDDDPVGLVLQLLVLGQVGMQNIDSPDAEKLAEIVAETTKQLPDAQWDRFWQLLASKTEQSTPPATETYQRFRKMTAPTSRLGRVGSRLIKRFLGRKK